MANKNLQKLELTWIGKGEEPKLEPCILIENQNTLTVTQTPKIGSYMVTTFSIKSPGTGLRR